jgi:transposase
MGIPTTTVNGWVAAYRERDVDGVMPKPRVPVTRPPMASDTATREAVIRLKQSDPDLGTRKIRDLLARFSALGVSETQVRRILHEAGPIEVAVTRQESSYA